MKALKKFMMPGSSAALISIHPTYVGKILSGEKRLEFRRRWTKNRVDYLVIYATSPLQRIVAVAAIGQIFKGSKSQLWELSRSFGGGISRRGLFKYMNGRKEGIALELSQTFKMTKALEPESLFGRNFRPPQSFRYLNPTEVGLVSEQISTIQ